MIEKFNHFPSEEGPGSDWRPGSEDRINHGEHSVSVAELISESRYDVFVRYGYANSIVNGNMDEEYLFWKATYDKMQNHRVGFSRSESFDAMITDFEEKGFEGKPAIPVDRSYELLDGAHRLACSAVFDIRPKVIIFNALSHPYNKDWFEGEGFGSEELQKINEVKNNLTRRFERFPQKSYIGVVWGVALEYWEEILSSIPSPKLRRSFIRDFEGYIETFIKESYTEDGMEEERIVSKSKKLASISSKAGIIAISDNLEEVSSIKRKIRNEISKRMDEYFFDNIIHIIDSREIGQALLKKYDPRKK